jgi:hypothetical protein
MHEEQLGIVREQFATVRTALNTLATEELPALEARLQAAGVPWTPGRAVPPAD